MLLDRPPQGLVGDGSHSFVVRGYNGRSAAASDAAGGCFAPSFPHSCVSVGSVGWVSATGEEGAFSGSDMMMMVSEADTVFPYQSGGGSITSYAAFSAAAAVTVRGGAAVSRAPHHQRQQQHLPSIAEEGVGLTQQASAAAADAAVAAAFDASRQYSSSSGGEIRRLGNRGGGGPPGLAPITTSSSALPFEGGSMGPTSMMTPGLAASSFRPSFTFFGEGGQGGGGNCTPL